jgi:hypothetical protein
MYSTPKKQENSPKTQLLNKNRTCAGKREDSPEKLRKCELEMCKNYLKTNANAGA